MAFSDLIGSSPKFRAVLDDVRIASAAGCTVLIHGETGTGKEQIARVLHECSPRRHHPFVPLNCSAIPATLLETELFGHERGAFTGAVAPRAGRFQAADKGTLFLDEIGDLPLELQPKLLRVLQEHEFERIGSCQSIRVDVRIVAATNQDLSAMVRHRRFRADLYYRLNVFPVTLPPLRERPGDIALLAEHFVQMFARRQGKSIGSVPAYVLRALEAYSWPGNVRELQNFIERSVILTTGPELRAPIAELMNNGVADTSISSLADADRACIIAALREANGVVGGRNGAAVRLGLKRTTLIARMKKLGLTPETARWEDDTLDGARESPPDRLPSLA